MPIVDAQLAQADRNYRRRSSEVVGILSGFMWAGLGATLGDLLGAPGGLDGMAFGLGAGAAFAFGFGLFRLHRAEVRVRKAMWARRE